MYLKESFKAKICVDEDASFDHFTDKRDLKSNKNNVDFVVLLYKHGSKKIGDKLKLNLICILRWTCVIK